MAARWRVGGLVLALAFLPWLAPAHAEPNFPELTGRVVDDADLLSYPEEVAITADLKALEDKSSDQVVVVTLPSLQGYTIEDFGYQLGRHWGIGTEKLDNGVIADRRAQRAQGPDRGRPRPRRRADRCVVQDHHRKRDPAALPRGQLRRRHQGWRARRHSRADRRRGRGRATRQGAPRCRREHGQLAGGDLLDIDHFVDRLQHLEQRPLCVAGGRPRRRADLPAGSGLGQRLRRQRLERRRGGGGGGFSGGGGSFGGGGASGGW